MNIRIALAVAALVGVLAGCASTGETPESATSVGPLGSASVPSTGSTSTGVATGSPGGEPISGTRAATADALQDWTRSVYYEFDRSDVRPEYRPLVESHARWLKANPAARLRIVGNTDERGSREYNIALGQRRAESVTALLVLLGARSEQVEAVSFGKEKPRAPGHDEAAFAENRRSDFARP